MGEEGIFERGEIEYNDMNEEKQIGEHERLSEQGVVEQERGITNTKDFLKNPCGNQLLWKLPKYQTYT